MTIGANHDVGPLNSHRIPARSAASGPVAGTTVLTGATWTTARKAILDSRYTVRGRTSGRSPRTSRTYGDTLPEWPTSGVLAVDMPCKANAYVKMSDLRLVSTSSRFGCREVVRQLREIHNDVQSLWIGTRSRPVDSSPTDFRLSARVVVQCGLRSPGVVQLMECEVPIWRRGYRSAGYGSDGHDATICYSLGKPIR